MFRLELAAINARCRSDPAALIGESEQRYANVIESIAERVCGSVNERPILLLNGPSSSGKTTTARRIREAIERRGVPSYAISMDDYYLSRDTLPVPVDEEGQPDLESPECMDLPLLSDHLNALCEGRAIETPTYDFQAHSRTAEKREFCLKKGEIAVIEGIHALNGVITGRLRGRSTGIYMAIGTEVVGDGWRLAPHQLRFVRRAIRDRNFRGAPVGETIRMWRSVRRGEKLYIRPYIPSAEYIVNTYLDYEDCVLMSQLRGLCGDYHQQMIDVHLEPVVRALDAFAPLEDLSLIPAGSIMHEFIG